MSLAQRLRCDTLDAVYASPLERTLATAYIIAASHGVARLPEPGLGEIDYGRWEGRSRDEV